MPAQFLCRFQSSEAAAIKQFALDDDQRRRLLIREMH
jgi:hypothetical protein